MIQIQDDNINQSASVSQPQSSSNSSDQSAQPAQSNAEIDQLLAELDRLSKDLDEKPVSSGNEVLKKEETVEYPSPATSDEKFDFDGFLSDLEKKIDQESKRNEPGEISEMTPTASKEPTSDEVIEDFPDPEDFADDFRKNRSATDLEDDREDMPEQGSELSSETFSASEEPTAEELKSQNIFEMLGLTKISDEEKNQFLDELESMIWDDFVVHDLELLLTSEEYAGAREILDKPDQDDEKKEALIAYLDKLIPDLDEVLYEKALELKSEMLAERLSKTKDGADQATLDKVKEAEDLISQNRWKSAVSLLNQLS
ncbi:MAG: hypothetical protein UT13_C0001G0812 [Candidatus Pacebacteria bacterium GW2011_GWF2_38_9]|nr:MAG: hypothetical protein US01_C0001G0848 [candidate division TM6 bacterium GW2011_GWF2_28_16]KKQ07827.1 MAG: hypothetical protein US20_C0028G0006 [Candidatus Pacebacteria bacterium GW2011_GWF1_36_5]KKQ89164.1 MAG: hypothetical protein UT13_C0001G0812 [Candidatus Pacebacteria bacterium GW2011_GWF2_38_9]